MDANFHISLPCDNIEDTKAFYLDTIGATSGRQAKNWLDVNLFNNQITFTKAGKFNFNSPNYVFEGKILPAFHFGIIVDVDTWGKIYTKLQNQNLELVTQATFLKDKKGEHLSFFIKDPNGYILEFKSFKDKKEMFEI